MKVHKRIVQLSLGREGRKASLCRACFLIWMVILLIVGCSPSESKIISVDNENTGQSVVASVGEKIEVTLQTVGPGQYGGPDLIVRVSEVSGGNRQPAHPTRVGQGNSIGSRRFLARTTSRFRTRAVCQMRSRLL